MSSVELLLPAFANVYVAILGSASPVLDDEVVGDAVFHVAFFSVESIYVFRSVGDGAAMVNDDGLPLALFNRNFCQSVSNTPRKAGVLSSGSSCCRRNLYYLASSNLVEVPYAVECRDLLGLYSVSRSDTG